MTAQILNLDELAALEKRYANQLPAGELMNRAGRATADIILEKCPQAEHVVIICGPGNNGGDGFACALHLKALGIRVTCCLIGCNRPKTEDAARFFDAWIAQGGIVIEDPYNADKADVVVDALFGTGMTKALGGDYLSASMWFNERQALHVSIDLPSGLDAMTGNWVGGILGCRADITVCMLAPKAGCFMMAGSDAAGEVIVRELDVSVPLSTIGLIETSDFCHIAEPRSRNTHKGEYGHVAIVGGNTGMVGAALLAGRAALTMGAGKVTVECLAKPGVAVDYNYPELMFAAEPIDLTKTSCNVVGCGMGQTPEAKARLAEAIAANVPLILDADALRMIAADMALQDAVLARKAHTVLTPHVGEAAAILRCPKEKIMADRIGCARELSIQTGAITVLKGAGSVVTLRSSRTWINPTGNAMLATAGSGDVLSGMLGAFFAQGFDLVSSTLGAVWLHGAASDEVYAGMTASDIAPAAAQILDGMRRSHH